MKIYKLDFVFHVYTCFDPHQQNIIDINGVKIGPTYLGFFKYFFTPPVIFRIVIHPIDLPYRSDRSSSKIIGSINT